MALAFISASLNLFLNKYFEMVHFVFYGYIKLHLDDHR